jgi:hypothetical protein
MISWGCDPILIKAMYDTVSIAITIHIDTFGRKISAKKIVVRMNIPATNIPVPMLMYVLRENVTRASTTITILEM